MGTAASSKQHHPRGQERASRIGRRRRLRLLIVDDNSDFRSLLGEVLTLKGVAVLQAESGEHALSLIQDDVPDAVLLDHRMPGLNGAEVVGELRRRGVQVPVILMTAAESARGVAAMAGVTHWIGKPFELEKLRDVLELALRGKPIRPPYLLDG